MPAPTERFLVASSDGVELSVQKAGSGPALLLIHGALLNGPLSWGMVLPKLAEHFTVYVMDRRGRAPSGDAREYSLAIEGGDIARVVQAIGPPVKVLAHSYGALATLEALGQLNGVDQLLLYEPPLILAPLGPEAQDRVARMERALEAGDRSQVVTVFLREQIGVPPERLSALQSSPIWPVVLQIASTLPRESANVNTYRRWDERLAKWKSPTVMLLGSETVGLLKDAVNFVSQAIPGCRLVVLPGQGHGAMMDAPDLFARTVLELLSSAASQQTAG